MENIKRLPYEEQIKLFKSAQTGDIDARNRLVEEYYLLVVNTANKYFASSYKDLIDDCIQIGCITLIDAIMAFNLSMGTKFSTFAVPRLRLSMSRYILKSENMLNIPIRIRYIMGKYLRACSNFIRDYGFYPSDDDIVAYSKNISYDELKKMVPEATVIYSTDSLLTNSNGDDIEDTRFASTDESPEVLYQDKERALILNNIIDSLTPRERDVIRYKYGFENNHPYSTSEICAKLGITRQRVNKLEQAAIKKIKLSNQFSYFCTL